ncbi:MAG: DUF1841 family protein [Gammaproteobacteria bacterium]|nr:DUF1841 family protein [Gammaproteobacteria bacterium]
MLFGQNRDQLRRFYIESWRKQREKAPMSPLEAQIAEVVALHPEYYALLEDEERAIDQEFSAESGQGNPFMHMGMHLGLREQLSTDRPAGIKAVHDALERKIGDTHETEHRMMECLGQVMWDAQQSGTPPDEQNYLECLRRL